MMMLTGMDQRRTSISHRKLGQIRRALVNNLVNEEQPLAAFVDVEAIRETVRDLQSSFSDNFFHTFAVKANAMRPVLNIIRQCGMGAEVASPGEMMQALAAGFLPENMVFDEPAKSDRVIRRALESGISLNIDNFEEFKLICEIANEGHIRSNLGFRINPQIGAGGIVAMSTATSTSKFGVPLGDEGMREQLIRAYCEHPWLNSLHTHVGSQGCPLELMAQGVEVVVSLAEEINRTVGHQQIQNIDIGGGLSVNFDGEEVSPGFADYAKLLRQKVPVLFTEKYRVLTEFGRSIMAKNGFIVSRVEYSKVSGERHIAITHAGAQVAARTAFMPDAWPLRVTAHRASGELKVNPTVVQDIAGPCCFSGDLVASQRSLPRLERGDMVVLHDTGAYYFSNPFYYNSLPAPAVYGIREEGDDIFFETMRRAQSIEEMMDVVG